MNGGVVSRFEIARAAKMALHWAHDLVVAHRKCPTNFGGCLTCAAMWNLFTFIEEASEPRLALPRIDSNGRSQSGVSRTGWEIVGRAADDLEGCRRLRSAVPAIRLSRRSRFTSLNSRTFSIAITAWSAKVLSSSTCSRRECPGSLLGPASMAPTGNAVPQHRDGHSRACDV